ncbi:putative chorismate synthase [Toxoplasma gondii TgCatPRC2]|uniref:chorismate synthase n=9 Tax=Toxoplasma gondii TaxID=5811 RepID=A0A151HBD2_TOXGO|nr:chorismate synthase, putative [Toxoplasma gondii ME49]KFG41169.1 putative chorismate synthase [Toxoplasma gondii GAB2-2007-GAL-DOM2]KFG53531.1 putative chorismate synthase [Toxoplasma gondii FOU]KFG62088.1 putative chorismate synthase [Toxoplasma gondii RUB]KFH06876.1 putative chorismate synthase [Toxoplasma gondii VAND]KFH11538.1 putative chorismate synthase [Toxoplasma gondii MAS]KYK66644.1 putative chorismate synthase [Toxoplasma gondii TgCatPRC2]PIL99845.1 putative chorismate synthase|eukprot:XP_002367454.1 chorismate synthase, putative [Toxoplasma gondii ME49]
MSSYGAALRIHTFGESHGSAVGCIIDGLPPRLPLSVEDVQPQLNRRRPGQGPLSTQRREKDRVNILSGVEDGYTLGTPLAMLVWNEDRRPQDYHALATVPRPGHGDFTYHAKYHIHAKSGGGRSSARETLARVAAGAVVEKWLGMHYGTSFTAWVCQVGDVSVPRSLRRKWERQPPTRQDVDRLGVVRVSPDGTTFLDANNRLYDERGEELVEEEDKARRRLLFGVDNPTPGETVIETRCPCPSTAVRMAVKINQTRSLGDSIGGCISGAIVRPPLGLGEPCFDKVEAELAKAMMSLPATKGFEIGQGFASVTLRGSEHNDRFIPFERASCSFSESAASTSKHERDGCSAATLSRERASDGRTTSRHEEEVERGRERIQRDTLHVTGVDQQNGNSEDSVRYTSKSEASITRLSGNAASGGAPVCRIPLGEGVRIRCGSNNAGGTLAGITSGENIFFRVAFKPVSSIGLEQETADFAGEMNQLAVKGRHDPCVLPRAPPLVESMAALVIGDLCLRQRAREGPHPLLVLPQHSGCPSC